jgi:hypothetical protein
VLRVFVFHLVCDIVNVAKGFGDRVTLLEHFSELEQKVVVQVNVVCAFFAFFCGFNWIECPIMAKASLAWFIRI